MVGHEVTWAGDWAFLSKSGDFAGVIDLVVFENSKFFLLSLVFVFLWSGVLLLLSFLATTTKSEHQVKGRFLQFT